MNAWPVIQRELISQARRPANVALRVGSALAVTTIFLAVAATARGSTPSLGQSLFYALNHALFLGIWIVVPLLTADCISEERRQGTLGLLRLTPLTPLGIVIGKSLAHGLRALTLVLAALPVMTVPFLTGGLGWRELALSLELNLASVLLALAAGLLASSWARDATRALILAELVGLTFCLALMTVHAAGVLALDPGFRVGGGVRAGRLASALEPLRVSPRLNLLKFLVSLATGANYSTEPPFWSETNWSSMMSLLPGRFVRAWLVWGGCVLAGAAAGLAAAMAAASWRLGCAWQDEAPSVQRQELERVFCTPIVFSGWLRRAQRRSLAHNPVGWLQQYTWSARLTKWGWCLALTIVETFLSTDVQLASVLPGQNFMATLLLISLTFSAVASFRRERQTGAMELILVTPLSVGQIVQGRLRGIYAQFGPAVAILIGLWVYVDRRAGGWSDSSSWGAATRSPVALISTTLCGFLCLAPIGLYASLLRLHLLTAWLGACALGLGLPWFMGNLLSADGSGRVASNMLVQLALTAWAWKRLHRNLAERRFALS